jgi:hypothetical protein
LLFVVAIYVSKKRYWRTFSFVRYVLKCGSGHTRRHNPFDRRFVLVRSFFSSRDYFSILDRSDLLKIRYLYF